MSVTLEKTPVREVRELRNMTTEDVSMELFACKQYLKAIDSEENSATWREIRARISRRRDELSEDLHLRRQFNNDLRSLHLFFVYQDFLSELAS